MSENSKDKKTKAVAIRVRASITKDYLLARANNSSSYILKTICLSCDAQYVYNRNRYNPSFGQVYRFCAYANSLRDLLPELKNFDAYVEGCKNCQPKDFH